MFNPEEFGKRVGEARREKKLRQYEVAEKIGVNQGYMSALEGGKGENPTVGVVYALAEALDVSPAYLLGLDTDAIHGLSDLPAEIQELVGILVKQDEWTVSSLLGAAKVLASSDKPAKVEVTFTFHRIDPADIF